MLLILAASVPNRLKYIAGLMVSDMLGLEVGFTTSPEEFSSHDGPKLAYGHEPAGNGVFIHASGLLFETAVSPYRVYPVLIDGETVLFESEHPSSELRFDPFAAGFYMATRYEEYQTHKKDKFGRFPVAESIAWQGKFLDVPIVHHWAAKLGELLVKRFPGLKLNQRVYNYVPTIDIDHAMCYLGRNFTRTLGGFGRSLVNGHFREVGNRFRVLSGMASDPYDNYDFIRKVHEPYDSHPLFFVLFADYGGNDNNVSVDGRNFLKLLHDLDVHQTVGIHPSLSSNKYLFKLEDEYDGLCEALDRDVTLSRQHFLKFSMPRTYRTLIQLGITHDYSMGYASNPGFRAGLAIPFRFYDLLRDEITPLVIHPVTLMDVTMKDYLRLSTEKSLEEISKMIQTIRSVNGEFVSIWHNESLGDTGRWAGWRAVYEQMVKMASS